MSNFFEQNVKCKMQDGLLFSLHLQINLLLFTNCFLLEQPEVA